ncbi:hypothetical protein BDV39DRAFT_207205 [Aspergillus sergii]|uniref:Uncharacterized protein n=1 Tax=Aspergillus sergii TaxID=1034303 RepID=A0A5N6WWT0_9EURO|nr:hypothetical protein BDV39DRAFT_207205 [Aspergillus sergii]
MLKLLWNLTPHVEVYLEMFINVKDAKKCQEILNAVKSTTKIDKDSGYIAILDLILESDFEIEVMNDLVIGTFNARHRAVLQTFLEQKVDIKLSQEIVNKALELQDHDA